MRKTEILKTDWSFTREGFPEETVRIPHDWAIRGPFDAENDLQIARILEDGEPVETAHYGRTGGLPHPGNAVYRKIIRLTPEETKKNIRFEFDGIMSHSEIFMNGRKIAERPYGYSSFSAEASQTVKSGENLLEIRVKNPPFSSRWYPGAGIFREVRMVLLEPEHFLYSGIRIRTERIDTEKRTAVLTVETETSVPHPELRIEMEIEGKKYEISGTSPLHLDVSGFECWSAGSPILYPIRISLVRNGEIKDVQTIRIGFRNIGFDAENGMTVNGNKEKLNGVCLHHDLGPLGAAFNRSAMLHRLKLLKEIGCNAIRTSHNMPDPKLPDLCDELGFYVIDEAFDCWKTGKTENDYHCEYDEWHERDLSDFMKRDRNHPSVIMWSIGNEIPEQQDPHGADFVRELKSIVRRFDDRPVTAGFNRSGDAIKNGLAASVDIAGWNYKPQLYPEYHRLLPHIPQYGNETASTVSTRGFYALPVKEGSVRHECGQCSSYDVEYPSWANTPETEFRMQENCPWILGEFVWTGFDYLGEPTPYNQDWPTHSSYFGIFDLAGLPKDRAFLYAARWGKKNILHILPHWNWEGHDGENIPVHVYTGCHAVELFVNGKSQGTKTAQFGRVRFDDVIYEPGEITAYAKDASGKTIACERMKTAGEPAAIRLSPDRALIPADEEELAFITAEIVDAEGIPCPLYDGLLRFDADGAGSYAFSANGDPRSLEIFSAPEKHAFYGKCMIAVRAGSREGTIRLKVNAENLPEAVCEIRTVEKV